MRKELVFAAKRSQLLEVIYVSNNGNTTKRTVKLIKINNSTFTAYCFLRKERRTFAINNILAVVPLMKRVVG